MNCFYSRFAGCLIVGALFTRSLLAAEPADGTTPAAATATNPNAAIIYWQAFAVMPTLNGDQKQKWETASKTGTGPVADDLRPILTQFEPALRELNRARAVSFCDWQLDYSAGPQLLMPHLQKARELSYVAIMRSRSRFAAGDTAAAVADVMAVLKMARDCGKTPIMIAMLVDVAMERNAIEVLAANLPALKPDQLDQLAVSMKQLPSTASFARCIEGESSTNGGWLERLVEAEIARINDPKAGSRVIAHFQKQIEAMGDEQPKVDEVEKKRLDELFKQMTVADVKESIRRMYADYTTMATIASLSSAQQGPRWADFESQLKTTNRLVTHEDSLRYFSSLFLPQGSKAYDREEQQRIRRDLIELAVQVQRHGSDAMKSSKSIGNGKVDYHKTDVGFDLSYQLDAGGKTLTLSVGTKK